MLHIGLDDACIDRSQTPGSIHYPSTPTKPLLALNERNEAFFRASDGIFTNYCWKEDEPARSAARAEAAAGADGNRSRRWDVFMGIDCFGRNTYGGGGFDCDVALRAIRQSGVSAALFAPGWVWEEQVERARRRALGEEEEQKGEGEGEETEGVQQKEGGETAASAVAISAVEKEKWDWRRVEAEFEATQERFWAKIGAMWSVRWCWFWVFSLFPDFITHVRNTPSSDPSPTQLTTPNTIHTQAPEAPPRRFVQALPHQLRHGRGAARLGRRRPRHPGLHMH